ncbi:MAG: hypothetical protein AAGA65_17955 [Actinomycetota bacterium]
MRAANARSTSLSEHGAFWIASNLRLDFAALNKVEMLPWDIWGLGWEPPDEPTDDMLSTFDSVAELTVDPDQRFHELRQSYESHASLRMEPSSARHSVNNSESGWLSQLLRTGQVGGRPEIVEMAQTGHIRVLPLPFSAVR